MHQDHSIDVLWKKLTNIAPYPAGVVPVPTCIKGTAFFPGGTGLWDTQPHGPLPPMPMGKVMIVGQDFSSEVDYYHCQAHGSENLKTPTWRNLLWLLAQVHIPAHACFFTNMFMGLRAGNAKLTGRFPGARSRDFVHQCQTFLGAQVAAQRPRLILTLGVHVPALMAPLSEDLAGWAHCKRFRALDLYGPPLLPAVHFPEPVHVTATVVALTHPCLWRRCVMVRQYGALQGREAELQMLREAITLSGLHEATP